MCILYKNNVVIYFYVKDAKCNYFPYLTKFETMLSKGMASRSSKLATCLR
jgi:hypothetical protein